MDVEVVAVVVVGGGAGVLAWISKFRYVHQ